MGLGAGVPVGVEVGPTVAVGVGVRGGVGVGVTAGVPEGVGEAGGVGEVGGVGEGVAGGVGVAVGGGLGVGVGDEPQLNELGPGTPTVMGDPVLKKPIVAPIVSGARSVSKRKLYNVPQRTAFAFWFCAKVSELQLTAVAV